MKAFLDERSLSAPDLAQVLRVWLKIADFRASSTAGLNLYLDKDVVKDGRFKARINALSRDVRMLYMPMLFGEQVVADWRPEAVGGDSLCQLETETDSVADCAVCETYEHRRTIETIALIGADGSSFANRRSIQVQRLLPPDQQRTIHCGTTFVDFQRVCETWKCVLVRYDSQSVRTPRDEETVLSRSGDRYVRTGRFERSGRRAVYKEIETGRLLYVDNLHVGAAAHLEVFDEEGRHLGVADLDGRLDPTRCIRGRQILW